MALFQIRDIQLHDDDEDTFATDLGGSFSARSVRCVSQPVLTPAQVVVDNPALRQRLAQFAAPILALKNASKVTLSTALVGTGTAALDSVEALGGDDLAESQLLRNAFGGESLGTGSVVEAAPSPTATGFTVTSAAGMLEGQAVLVLVGDGYEATVIKTIATNALTFTRALSAAPVAGAAVCASATYYPKQVLGDTLQIQAIGGESEDGYFRMLGCQSDVKFNNLAPGNHPQLDFDLSCASWVKLPSATLAIASYLNISDASVPGLASSLFIGQHGVTTRTLVHCSALSLDPGLGTEGIPSVSGTQGLQGFARSGIAPVLDATIFPWNDSWQDLFEARTAQFIHYQIGSTPGNTVLIEIQRAHLNAVPMRAAIGAQVGVQIKGVGVEDETLGTDELDIAAFRLHLL